MAKSFCCKDARYSDTYCTCLAPMHEETGGMGTTTLSIMTLETVMLSVVYAECLMGDNLKVVLA